jgi:hypothetical protein
MIIGNEHIMMHKCSLCTRFNIPHRCSFVEREESHEESESELSVCQVRSELEISGSKSRWAEQYAAMSGVTA